MSEDNKCRCGHNYAAHTYEKMENGKVCDCFHCKECGKDQNGNFECEGFCRVGSLPPEFRARIKAENEARKKAQDDARKKAQDEARKKAQDEARKKEKEQLEKEQLEKERLEKERLEKEQYRYQELFHICHIDNLPSIIEKGLFSRINAQQNLHGFNDIANLGIVTDRRVGLTTFASTYFEPINAMYINKKQDDECGINNIVVVGFDLDLQNSEMVFYDGNAAVEKTVKTNYYDHSSFVKIMSEIQKETIEIEYKGHGQWPGGKEDPAYKEHLRRKQAECLVPNKISRDCITSIHVYDDPELTSAATRIIDNSGLRIRLETLDKYQKSIKRRKH